MNGLRRRMYVLKPRARVTDFEWDHLQYIRGLLEGLQKTDQAHTIAVILDKLEPEIVTNAEEEEG